MVKILATKSLAHLDETLQENITLDKRLFSNQVKSAMSVSKVYIGNLAEDVR